MSRRAEHEADTAGLYVRQRVPGGREACNVQTPRTDEILRGARMGKVAGHTKHRDL